MSALTRLCRRGLAGVLLFFTTLTVYSDPHGGGQQEVTGFVYRQGLVLNEQGEPSFAEYDRGDGSLIQVLSQFDASDDELWIGNGDDFAAAADAFVAFLDALPEGRYEKLTVIDIDTFNDTDAPEGVEKGTPYGTTRSLLVYREDALDDTVQIDADKGLIVYESRYDLNGLLAGDGSERQSLLLNGEGVVLYDTYNTIGYRVAYLEPDGTSDDERGTFYNPYETAEQTLLAPIPGVQITNAMNFNGVFGTDEEGFYRSSYYIPPCPGFTYDYSIPFFAAVPYRSFNPQREGTLHRYYFRQQTYYTCVGAPFYSPQPTLGANADFLSAREIYAGIQPVATHVNFPIDITLISGQFTLRNNDDSEVTVGDETRYGVPEPVTDEDYEADSELDLNGDEEIDHVSEPGHLPQSYIVEADDTSEDRLYGVWFTIPEDGTTDENGLVYDADDEFVEPDLVRLADPIPNFEDEGLLESISREDLLETDVYVFRESTGEMVVERRPFTDREDSPVNGVDEGTGLGYFELAIPGRDAAGSLTAQLNMERDYEAWQASLGVVNVTGRDTDSLRPGEPLKVVVVNRATGYIGTALTSVAEGSGEGSAIELSDVVLYPPNLKVHVEREYTVEGGSSAGKTRRYTVGMEGSALQSDAYVAVHTEWLDRDGSALPSALPGYTGRLASVIGTDFLSNGTAHFEITPGRQVELLDFTPGVAHQYLHISGEPKDGAVDFSSDPGASYPNRPRRFVPVRVAVYDAEASEALTEAQNESEATSEANLEQASSVHRWVYRPEMQYSVYALDIYTMERVTAEGETLDVERVERPVIGAGDTAFTIGQYIEQSEYDPLTLFGPEPELIYTIEQYEQLARPGYTLYEFGELGFLGALEPEDYLTINLVNNNDAGNVLWEWAFESLSIGPTLLDDETVAEDGTIVISADELPMDVIAIRFGGDADGEEDILTWRVLEGDAEVVDGPRQSDEGDGVWTNTLDIAPRAGNEVVLEGQLADDDGSAVRMSRVVVEPGMPHSIQMSTTGQAYMLGFGQTDVQIVVRDEDGNLVADGTPVSLTMTGGGLLNAEELGTVNGVATAIVTGGETPSSAVTLTASAFDATPAEATLSIEPLSIEVSGLSDTHVRFERSQIDVQVRAGGVAAPGVPVDLVATHGVVDSFNETTDENGRVGVSLVHLRPGEDASLAVNLGTDVNRTITYELAYAESDLPRVESADTMVVGDQVASGTFTHDRYDGVALDYDFSTTSPFAVQGDAGESVDVIIGDLADPNRAPLAAWPMAQLDVTPPDTVYHDLTLSAGAMESLEVAPSQKTGINGFGLAIAFAPVQGDPEQSAHGEPESPTTLLDLDGALRLIREANGSARLEISTDAGRYTLNSLATLVGVHDIEVRLIDDVLSFRIDDEREEIELFGESLTYTGQSDYTLRAPRDWDTAFSRLAFQAPVQPDIVRGRMLDATTVHVAAVTGGSLVNDAPMGAGSSLELTSGGTMSAALADGLAPDTGLGVRFDFKRRVDDTGASPMGVARAAMLELGNALSFEQIGDDRLRLTARTLTGLHVLETAPGAANPGTWHTVAARLHEDELTLSVDGVVYTMETEGALDWGTVAVPTLTLSATDASIRYDALRIYDWNTEPLLAIAEAQSGDTPSARYAGVLDAAGRAELTLQSLGHLNDQQADSALQTLRVAVTVGDERDYVSLVSSEYYQEMSAFLLEHLTENVPAIQENLNGSLPTQMMIGALDLVVPPAEAGLLSFGWTAINFIIPIGDAVILTQQLFYLATNSAEYDSVELIGSALGTLTIIPLAKPLKPFIPGFKGFLRVSKKVDGKFFTHVAGPLGRAVKQALKGRTDAILMWLPTFYLLAQMTADEESREALLFILNSIASEEDVQTWISYLSLPTDGWDGEGSAVASIDDTEESSGSILDAFIGTANAQSYATRRVLVRVRVVVRLITRIRGTGTGTVTSASTRQLMSAIRAVVKETRSLNASDIRSMVHTEQILGAAAAVGAVGLKNILNNARRMRVPPPLLVAILAYVESRRDCAQVPGDLVTCVEHETTIKNRLNGAYGGLVGRLARPKATLSNHANGAAFELVMLAYKHALFELGLSEWKPLEIGAVTKVPVSNAKNSPYSLARKVDLQLQNESSERLLVESKSIKSTTLSFKRWSVGNNGGGLAHRQFSLDCRTVTEPTAVYTEDDVNRVQGEWWFQKFSTATPPGNSPDGKQLERHESKLRQIPENGLPGEYGLNGAGEDMCLPPNNITVGLFDLRVRLLSDSLKGLLLNGVSEVTDERIESLLLEASPL